MKRFLGIMLALVLVFSMMPTAGAETTEITPTYEYVFTMNMLSPASSAANYQIGPAFENKAKFVDETLGHSWQPIDSLLTQGSVFMTGGYRFSVDATAKTRYPLGKNGTVFKITVGETGVYKPYFSFTTYEIGSVAKVFLTETVYDYSEQTVTGKNPNSLKEFISKVASGEIESKFSGSFKNYKAGATEFAEVKTEDFGIDSVTLEKDKEYFLVFSIDGIETQSCYETQPRYYYFQPYSLGLVKVETAEEDATVSEPISFVATSNVGTGDMMQVSGFEYDNFIDEIPAGTYVTVTAPEKEGYEFKHWLRGSRDNGVYVSNESSYSFTALTNTFLTAVYEEKANESDNTAVVEFYNGNGQYLEKKTSTIGGTVAMPTEAPSLTGFEFANEWKTENGAFTAETVLGGKLTRAVAQFEVIDRTFNVTDKRDNSVYKLFYGEKKTLTSDDAVYWVRDNTIVDYGKSYTYAVWDDTEISTAESGELVPVVLLDSDAKDGARMIEYNAAGKNVIEVGLVFGVVSGVTTSSCSSKATSQYRNQHGQFTAKPNGSEAYARGYLIYEENGIYKVVYSK